MADRKYYVMCDSGCKFESMTKEQILSAIMQAVNEGVIADIDAGFITTIKTINGHGLKFFVGPQSEFEALDADEKKDLFAIITNDTTKESLLAAIEELNNKEANLESDLAKVLSGETLVPKADYANDAHFAYDAVRAENVNGLTIYRDSNGALKIDDIIIPQKKVLFSGEKTISNINNKTVIYEDSNGVGNRCYEAIIGGRAFKFYIKMYDIVGGLVSFPYSFATASIGQFVNLHFSVNVDDPTRLYCYVIYNGLSENNSELANYTNITALYEVIE